MAKRALKSFVPAGTRTAIKRDGAYPDNHPAVQAYPQMFMEIDVERATEAPGERRVLSSASRRKREAARAETETKNEDRSED